MLQRLLYLILLVGLLLPAPPLRAQSSADILRRAQARTDTILATEPTAQAYQSETQLRYNNAYWQYQTDVIRHRRKVYDWQHTSSIWIFAVVILIVLSGIGFSGIQFYIAAKSAQLSAATSSNIEVSSDGVKITSSVLGVIILTLSIVFFFLYLKYVYPISESPNVALQTSAADSAPKAPPADKPAAPQTPPPAR